MKNGFMVGFILLIIMGDLFAENGCMITRIVDPSPFLIESGEIITVEDGERYCVNDEITYDRIVDGDEDVVVCPVIDRLFVSKNGSGVKWDETNGFGEDVLMINVVALKFNPEVEPVRESIVDVMKQNESKKLSDEKAK